MNPTREAPIPAGFTRPSEILAWFIGTLTPQERHALIVNRIPVTVENVRKFGRGLIPTDDVPSPATPYAKVTPLKKASIGSITADFAADLKAKRLAAISREGARIKSRYGVTSDADILAILHAEEELATCENCCGLPCLGGFFGKQPKIGVTGGKLVISYTPCKFVAIERQRLIAQKLKRAKIPERYVGKTFADYDVDSSNRDAVAYAKTVLKTRRGAYLHGERGTGKTFLASIIAQEFLKAGKTVVFEKVPNLLADIRDTFNGKGKYSEAELVKAACSADLLVLDDFGMEKPTRFVGTTLCSIIDARYDQPHLTTIITSNNTIEQIRTELDKAIDGENYNGSRIHDRCMEICKPILLKGNSRRR